jgi:hypothetical protein
MKPNKFKYIGVLALVYILIIGCSKKEEIIELKAEFGELELNFSALEMSVGESQRLAVLTDIGPVEIGWSSTDSTKVTVNEYGLIKAISGGNVSVIAKVGMKTTECTLKVSPDIYFAGHKDGKPCYWKNGKVLRLSENEGQALSIFVTAKDVYACGYEVVDGKREAVYWKNSIATYLSDDKDYSTAYDLYIYDHDIYIIATDKQGKLAYWKNDEKVIISSSGSVYAKSLYVSSGDVYIAGNIQEEAFGIRHAVYWKNTEIHKLTSTDSVGSSADAIFVQQNNVYAIGTDGSSFDHEKYWKNGQHMPISTLAPPYRIHPTDIFVTKNDVYITGYEYNNGATIGGGIAKYWKNGVGIPLNDGSTLQVPWSIKVFDDNIYIAGVENHYTSAKAVYWKNGEKIELSDINDASGIYDIFLW